MAIDNYVTQTYPIECKGRDSFGNEVLGIPVEVKVEIFKSPRSKMISSNAECPYNTGEHGQRCKAAHPNADKPLCSIECPYSFDIPYTLETKNKSDTGNI